MPVSPSPSIAPTTPTRPRPRRARPRPARSPRLWLDGQPDHVGFLQRHGVATVTQANGSQLTFQYYAQGATEPVGLERGDLVPVGRHCRRILSDSPPLHRHPDRCLGGHRGALDLRQRRKSPITYSFTSAGVLNEIADAAGTP